MWKIKPVVSLFVVTCGISVVCGGHLFHHPMKARRRCCLPNHAYSQSQKSNPETATSFTGSIVSAGLASTTPDSRQVKTFIMNKSELRSHHCSISKVACTVDSDGFWIVNFDATQDPMSVSEAERPKYVRFIQNKLYVTVRVYGQYEVGDNQAVVAEPQLVNIPLEGIWLKRGETRRNFVKGHHPDLRTNYSLINRIEIDLQYE